MKLLMSASVGGWSPQGGSPCDTHTGGREGRVEFTSCAGGLVSAEGGDTAAARLAHV